MALSLEAYLNKPALNENNVALNNLHENLNDIIKNKRYSGNVKQTNKLYSSYRDAVKSINKSALEDDATTEYKTSSIISIEEENTELSDEIVDNLIRIGKTIYNKKNKDISLLFTVKHPYFMDTVYCYNSRQEGFNYCVNKYNMLFYSQEPLIFLNKAPFSMAQYYTLLKNIGNH